MQAGTLVAQHWIAPFIACFPEGFFEFGALAVGNVEHSLALPYLSTAHLLHAFWEDDFVAGFVDELAGGVYERRLHGSALGKSHGLVDAGGEVDNLQLVVW